MGITRAGTEQLAMLLGGLVRFDDPQGLACVKLTEWNEPGEGDDDELAVYGVNSGSGHVIYNATMYTLGLYGGEGSGQTQLSSPHGIAADPGGTVVVADTGNGRLVILERRGARLRPRSFVTQGLVEPWGVALGDRQVIYATDRAGGALLVYDGPEDVEPMRVPLDSPRGVAVYGGGSWNYYDEDFAVVVCDDGASLARVDGSAVTATAVLSDCGGSSFCYPALDYYGNTWVTDSAACMIHKFDRDLDHVGSFEAAPGQDGLDGPTGIALWRRYGQVFVAEREGARYLWVGTDIEIASFEPSPRGLSLSGRILEPSNMLAQVLDPGGSAVFTLHNGRIEQGGFEFDWDGTDVNGDPVPGGAMTVSIAVEPTYSSRGYFEKTLLNGFQMQVMEPDTTGSGRRR
jgi:hypothetical protein